MCWAKREREREKKKKRERKGSVSPSREKKRHWKWTTAMAAGRKNRTVAPHRLWRHTVYHLRTTERLLIRRRPRQVVQLNFEQHGTARLPLLNNITKLQPNRKEHGKKAEPVGETVRDKVANVFRDLTAFLLQPELIKTPTAAATTTATNNGSSVTLQFLETTSDCRSLERKHTLDSLDTLCDDK